MLGEKLTTLRKKMGYSQQKLADRLLVTRQTISNWELDQGAPSLDKAAELAAIYGISLDDLVKDNVEVVADCSTTSPDRMLKQAEGKYIKLSVFDIERWVEMFADCRYNEKVKVVEVRDRWLKIEYNRTKENHLIKQETVVKLIDIDMISGIEIMEG